MRIIYGLNSQGQGHLSKAAVLVPLLEARGHAVRVISSGPTLPACYRFGWHRHFSGLDYAVSQGRSDYRKTLWQWAGGTPTHLQTLWQLRGIVAEFEPELILSDFEPFTASPLLEPRCEVLAVSRQVALLDRAIPLPEGGGFERQLVKTVIRVFTSGADRRLGYHYSPASYRCLPPLIRDELRRSPHEMGDHFLVYTGHRTTERNPGELIDWARRTRSRVLAYGFDITPGRQGLVEFRAAGRTQFLTDLATCRGVLTTAGLTTPLEAFVLGKPVCAVPIENQWEQLVNAFHLEVANLARWGRTWRYDDLLELEPPAADHPLRSWLSRSPEEVLDRIVPRHQAAVLSSRRAA